MCVYRSANREKLEGLLTAQYVDRVEIVMKEQIGVKGRDRSNWMVKNSGPLNV